MKWQTVKFGEFAEVQPSVALSRGEQYPFIPMEIVEPHQRQVNPTEERSWDGGGGAKFQNLDTIFARITPCLENGKIAQVRGLEKNAGFGSTEFLVFRGRSKFSDSTFIYYLACSGAIREAAIKSMVGASGRQRAQRSVIEKISVRVPVSLAAQREIADSLSAYDDLIENNRRRIKLLEEAARLVYREWFVRLKFPRSRAVGPAKADGHERARIKNGLPEGWEKKPLNELTGFLKRGITPHYDDDAEWLVINQKCIRDGRLDINLARRQSREVSPERQVRVGDVLVNSTGEGTLGRVAQVKAPIEHCTVDTHVTIVRPKPDIPIHFFGMAVMAWESQFSTMGRGATNQTELSPDAIGAVDIVMPSRPLIEQFESFVAPIYDQVTNLISQNDKARAARDLLLPRLMNGEIIPTA